MYARKTRYYAAYGLCTLYILPYEYMRAIFVAHILTQDLHFGWLVWFWGSMCVLPNEMLPRRLVLWSKNILRVETARYILNATTPKVFRIVLRKLLGETWAKFNFFFASVQLWAAVNIFGVNMVAFVFSNYCD